MEIQLKQFIRTSHDYAVSKGFWQGINIYEPSEALAKLMLITTEVAEAAEAVRQPNYGNLPEELADILIRVADLAGALEIDLDAAIEEKMQKNYKRSYMHGKRA